MARFSDIIGQKIVSDDVDMIYKDSTIFMSQRSASEIAQLIGMPEKSASMIFNLYGRSTKQKTKTMSLYDFIHFINSDLANRKILGSQINAENRKWLKQKEEIMSAALRPNEIEGPEEETAVELVEHPTETVVETIEVYEEPKTASATPTIDEENIEKLDMAEQIMDIAMEGNRFDAAEMHTLLNTFDAKVEMRDIELAYLYNGITHFDNDSVTMSAEEILETLAD